MTIGQNVKAALLAGLAGGAVLALFSLVFTTPLIDQAIELEQGQPGTVEEGFSRGVMKLGMVLGFIIYGVFLGILFGSVYGLFDTLLPGQSDKSRIAVLAAAAYWAVSLFPFLKYPANPPGVGGLETIQFRQTTYLVLLGLSLATTVMSLALMRKLRGIRPGSWIVGVGFAALLAAPVYFFLPPHPAPPVTVPVSLLWGFRALSIAGLTLFWLALAVAFMFLRRRSAAT
ncbi:MAG: CbtA family protein [Chloroflexi bacterium]|nr:CbtA family protein [Chloroflexota bacterium]